MRTFQKDFKTGNTSPFLWPLEWLICGIILAGCAVLHLTQYYYPLALPIEAGLSIISFATPISGMLYLSAAQVIPDAPGCPLSCAQMALCGFFMWQLATGKIMNIFRDGGPLLIAVAPFFIWSSGLSLMRGNYQFGLILFFAILTGCAAATLVRQSGNRLAASLVAFLAGHALAMCLFWILKLHLGLPIQAFDTEVYGDSTLEAMRIGTARGNANMLGPPMALVCIGAIGWFISRPKIHWLGALILLGCLAAVAPPLIGSGSRGAIVSVVWGLFFLVLTRFLSRKSFGSAPLAIAGIVVVLAFVWQRLGLNEHWQEMADRQEKQELDTGSTLAAGRELEWEAAWNGILNSPIIGGGTVTKLSYLNQEEFWMSHSTYLDAGLVGGFPGMALFVWLALKPILELWRRKHDPDIALLLAVYLVSIISIGSTSAMQLKHFWMLWGIAAACFLPSVANVKIRRAQSGGLTSNNLRFEGAQAEANKLKS